MNSFSILRRQAPSAHVSRATFTRSPATIRLFSHSRIALARKDAQGKDDIKVEPNEYAKSGSDPQAAQSDEAFSADKTRPEEQHAAAGADDPAGGNPLDVSPANKDVSQPRGHTEGGHEGSASESKGAQSDRERTSGGSSNSGGKKGQGQKYA